MKILRWKYEVASPPPGSPLDFRKFGNMREAVQYIESKVGKVDISNPSATINIGREIPWENRDKYMDVTLNGKHVCTLWERPIWISE